MVVTAPRVVSVPQVGLDLRPVNLDSEESVGSQDARRSAELVRQLQSRVSGAGRDMGRVTDSDPNSSLGAVARLAAEAPAACSSERGCVIVHEGRAYHLRVQGRGEQARVSQLSPESAPELQTLARWWPSRVLNAPLRPRGERNFNTAMMFFSGGNNDNPLRGVGSPSVPAEIQPIAGPPSRPAPVAAPVPGLPNGCRTFSQGNDPGANLRVRAALDQLSGGVRDPRGGINPIVNTNERCLKQFIEKLQGQVCDVIVEPRDRDAEGTESPQRRARLRTGFCGPNQTLNLIWTGGEERASLSGARPNMVCHYQVRRGSGDVDRVTSGDLTQLCSDCGRMGCPDLTPSSSRPAGPRSGEGLGTN